MRPAIIFDDGLGQLSPLTDLRPAFDIRTGALTTLERLNRLVDVVALCVPDHLRRITEERHGSLVNRLPPGDVESVLLINGRCVELPDAVRALQPGHAVVDPVSGSPIAICLDLELASSRVAANEMRLTGGERVSAAEKSSLLERPWNVRTFRDRCIAIDLMLLGSTFASAPVPDGVTAVGTKIAIGPSSRVYPSVVLDAEPGPIVIDDRATVRPGAIITGPAYIGPHSTVLDRAVIRPNTVIGPHCKVAGEISGTIFQGYANKAHDGFLGDSYVGEWANLGAGTTNSNLLNTYAEVPVRSRPEGPTERTGETFMGCIIGDHAKFAICTRIMTGAVIHTGAMYAATAPITGCIPPFAWITDGEGGPGKRTYRLDKFTDVARTVMARRKVTPTDAYLARLAELHARTTV